MDEAELWASEIIRELFNNESPCNEKDMNKYECKINLIKILEENEEKYTKNTRMKSVSVDHPDELRSSVNCENLNDKTPDKNEIVKIFNENEIIQISDEHENNKTSDGDITQEDTSIELSASKRIGNELSMVASQFDNDILSSFEEMDSIQYTNANQNFINCSKEDIMIEHTEDCLVPSLPVKDMNTNKTVKNESTSVSTRNKVNLSQSISACLIEDFYGEIKQNDTKSDNLLKEKEKNRKAIVPSPSSNKFTVPQQEETSLLNTNWDKNSTHSQFEVLSVNEDNLLDVEISDLVLKYRKMTKFVEVCFVIPLLTHLVSYFELLEFLFFVTLYHVLQFFEKLKPAIKSTTKKRTTQFYNPLEKHVIGNISKLLEPQKEKRNFRSFSPENLQISEIFSEDHLIVFSADSHDSVDALLKQKKEVSPIPSNEVNDDCTKNQSRGQILRLNELTTEKEHIETQNEETYQNFLCIFPEKKNRHNANSTFKQNKTETIKHSPFHLKQNSSDIEELSHKKEIRTENENNYALVPPINSLLDNVNWQEINVGPENQLESVIRGLLTILSNASSRQLVNAPEDRKSWDSHDFSHRSDTQHIMASLNEIGTDDLSLEVNISTSFTMTEVEVSNDHQTSSLKYTEQTVDNSQVSAVFDETDVKDSSFSPNIVDIVLTADCDNGLQIQSEFPPVIDYTLLKNCESDESRPIFDDPKGFRFGDFERNKLAKETENLQQEHEAVDECPESSHKTTQPSSKVQNQSFEDSISSEASVSFENSQNSSVEVEEDSESRAGLCKEKENKKRKRSMKRKISAMLNRFRKPH